MLKPTFSRPRPSRFICLFALGLNLTSQILVSRIASADAPVSSASEPEATAGGKEAQAVAVPVGLPSSLVQIPFPSNFYSPYVFTVDKQARRLTVWGQGASGLKQIASYPADLGKSSGEKKSQGDFKTPEGIYFLQEKREGPGLEFSLYGKRAFTTDYPNFFDRREGKTGGGIWLHAVPDHVALTRGSRGCVVVRNDVILEISQYVKLGRTPILIQDHTETVPTKDLGRTTIEINRWLDSWRSAWETKNIDSYIAFYSDDFHSMRMNRAQWRTYKNRLAGLYKSIAVHLSRPAVFVDRDHAIVRFLQDYSSDQHSDVGEKVLYLKKTSGSYRIVGEIWSEESSAAARQEIETERSMTLSCTQTDDQSSCGRTSASEQ